MDRIMILNGCFFFVLGNQILHPFGSDDSPGGFSLANLVSHFCGVLVSEDGAGCNRGK